MYDDIKVLSRAECVSIEVTLLEFEGIFLLFLAVKLSFDIHDLLMHADVLWEHLLAILDLVLVDFLEEPVYDLIHDFLHVATSVVPVKHQNISLRLQLFLCKKIDNVEFAADTIYQQVEATV